jgi:type IV fimbrial biogenesis protein FimT
MPNSQSRARGFTLIELMLTIMILAILLAIAVPSFADLIRNNRAAEQTNELIGGVSLARSEANKRGMPVTICAAHAAVTGCAGVAQKDWGNGWIIFTDRDGVTGVLDGTDTLIREWPAEGGGLVITTAANGYFTFGADGRLAATSTVDTFTVQHPKCTGRNKRRLTFDLTGRLTTKLEAC